MKKASLISKVLPIALQTPISLQNIAKIELHHPKHKSGFPNTRSFIKKYIPSMRYYNETFVYKSMEVDLKQVKFVIFDKESQIIHEIQPEIKNSPEEILAKITKLDMEYKWKSQEKKEEKEKNIDLQEKKEN